MRLKDKVAIVTGAARGIGAGIARCLVAEGARAGIVDIDGAEAEATAAGLGAEALGVCADVSDEAAARAAVERVAERFGGLDILVNNAGGGGQSGVEALGNPFTNITQAGWDDMLATNLRTTFATTKATISHLQRRGGGSIVNIASIAGLIPVVALPAYGAAKAGVVSQEPGAGAGGAQHPRQRHLPRVPVDARVGDAGDADEDDGAGLRPEGAARDLPRSGGAQCAAAPRADAGGHRPLGRLPQ